MQIYEVCFGSHGSRLRECILILQVPHHLYRVEANDGVRPGRRAIVDHAACVRVGHRGRKSAVSTVMSAEHEHKQN